MAPKNTEIPSSEDDEAPESLSLSQSKKDIQKYDDKLTQARTAEKEKRRALNRERDRRLKEQAGHKKKRRENERGDSDLVERMERAMQEAQAEMDEDGATEEDHDDEEEFRGIEEEPSNEDEDMSSSGAESLDWENKINPQHLPDHLFTTAFAPRITNSTSESKVGGDGSKSQRKKRARRTNNSAKDVIIGSRAIRVLPQSGLTPRTGIAPSSKVKKFLDRSLGFKGNTSKTRGWERRPANIGVMRREGPAAGFVRSR